MMKSKPINCSNSFLQAATQSQYLSYPISGYFSFFTILGYFTYFGYFYFCYFVYFVNFDYFFQGLSNTFVDLGQGPFTTLTFNFFHPSQALSFKSQSLINSSTSTNFPSLTPHCLQYNGLYLWCLMTLSIELSSFILALLYRSGIRIFYGALFIVFQKISFSYCSSKRCYQLQYSNGEDSYPEKFMFATFRQSFYSTSLYYQLSLCRFPIQSKLYNYATQKYQKNIRKTSLIPNLHKNPQKNNHPNPHKNSLKRQPNPNYKSPNYKLNKNKQQNMRNGSIYQNSDAAMKDKLIADMKKQLSQLKELDHEYIKLLDEVKSVESKYSLLQDDGLRMENQYKIKADIARTNISQLRNELDGLKMQMHKYDVSIDEISREIANLNRVNQNKENQITGQMTLNQELQKNNEDQNQANRNLNQKIQSMKEQRNKYEAECERLRRLLEDCVNGLKSLEKEARHIQSSNNRHQTILQIAVADRDELMNGLKSREELVLNTNKKLDELNREREELKQKTNKLEKECIKSESDLKQTTSQLQNGIGKNKELMSRLKNQQKTLRHMEGELDRSLLDRQALVKQNAALAAEHDGLNSQIDRIMYTILEMEKFNADLQREIKMFIDTDQEARRMLNRRDAMTAMLNIVTTTLHKTSEQIAHLR